MLSRRISQSKKVNALSLKAQLIWTWTHPFLDDYGRYTADPEDIKTEVFPKNSKISVKDIEKSLLEAAGKELITLYIVEGKPYQEYKKFEDHQKFRADRPRQAEYPEVANGMTVGDIDSLKLSKVKISKDKRRDNIIDDNKRVSGAAFEILINNKDFIKQLSDLYKGVNIQKEILKMKAWVMANPDRLKKNWKRFMVNWLNKTFDQLPTRIQNVVETPTRKDHENRWPEPPQEFKDLVKKIGGGCNGHL